MIPRILNLQGMLGIAASLLLLGLFAVKAGEARHWRKQSDRFEQLYLGEQGALDETVANYRAAAETARLADLAHAARVAAEQRTISERTSNDFDTRWPMLALALCACSSARDRPQPLSAVAVERLCPGLAQPPAKLVKPPAKLDFLSTTASSPPSRRSSSTN